MHTRDIRWLAGFLEGEGSFTVNRGVYPRVTVASTDLDVLQHAASILGGNVLGPRKCGNLPHHKDDYHVSVNGKYAIAWMLTLYPLLGKRRRRRIYHLVRYWQKHSEVPLKDRPQFLDYEKVAS